jgi:hypothetical protein
MGKVRITAYLLVIWIVGLGGLEPPTSPLSGAFMVLYMHSSVAMITVLTTSISRSGKPLRAPMPRFHMIRSDAEAVVTYLKSLNASQWGMS